MAHQHSYKWKARMFRTYVTNQYFANRDEYDGAGQQQPYTFEQYTSNNLQQLRKDFKLHKRAVLLR